MHFSERSPRWLGCLSLALLCGQNAQAINLDVGSTDSIKSVASTIAHGMMSYYKGNDTGMPQGLLPNPYYWWEAGAMFGQMVEYWFYTGDDTYNDVVTQGLLAQVGPDNDYMPPNQTKTEGNDDQAFWAFAVMSAAEMKYPDPPSKSPSWLALAQAVFNLQANRWDTEHCGGGLRWQIFTFNNGYDYKNSISNGGFFQLAARLARYTGNDTYAQWAEKSYDWIQQTPLFTNDYIIYDGAQIENNCTIASKLQWSYNIGTFLMGAANMYNYTNGDPKWRTRVEGLLNGTQAFFPAQYGGNIMVEIACEPQQTCNYDQPSFKAYLARWMAATTQIAPFTEDFVNTKIRASAQGAAAQCDGGTDGVTCGRTWHSATWDGKSGVGEQMSALSVIQANLISKVAPPVTADKGGTSKGNPTAGSGGDNPQTAMDPNVNKPITTGDKAGAGILTALVLSGLAAILHTFPSLVSAGIQGHWQATTSSYNKRRKLSPDKLNLGKSNHRADTSERASTSPDPLAGPSSPITRRQIPVLPPHLRAHQGRSPTPEPPNTGSSSPSGACAGLNIDSDGSGNISGSEGSKRVGALAHLEHRSGVLNRSRGYRAASPAKRRASVMNIQDGDVDMVGQSNEADAPGNMDDNAKAARKRLAIHFNGRVEGDSADLTDNSATIPPLHTPQSGASSTRPSLKELNPAANIPPIDDQIQKVMSLVRSDWMSEGLKGYVVAYRWLSRVLSRGSDPTLAGKYGKEAHEIPLGPVDNTSLWLEMDGAVKYEDEKGEEFVFMQDNLVMGEDFEVLPQEAWDMIIKWYGMADGSPRITRYCHNTSTNELQKNLVFEISPPIFTILKLPDTTQGMQQKDLKERDARPATILASRHERYQVFLKRAKAIAGIDVKTKVRVWRIMGGLAEQQGDGMLTPAQSRSNSPAPGALPVVSPGNKLVLDVHTFAQLQLGSQRELVDAKDETGNANYNGRSTMDFVGLRQNQVVVLEEMVGGPAGGEWVSDTTTAKAKTNGVPISVTRSGATTVKDTLKPNLGCSRGTSPAPSGVMTRGRQNKTGRSRGTVGLGNQGNTCYMNSALQCVRSVEELTVYFLEDKYKQELNPTNPLSHNGEVAKAYARLLNEMYDPKVNVSFTPRNFKNIIGKYGPSFSGYQQQDSQEFLLFLLDGLQEDLNRIHKKPYIEKPDSTDAMVNDAVALRGMADKCWEIYKKRNDSVITDLFAGMYKSTVVCPVCDKVSIIFDPFNNLTLQLPIQNIWSKDIWFFPLRATPFRVAIDIDKNSSWSALCEYIAKKLDLDSKKLIMAEVWQHRLYKIFESKKSINEDNVRDADDIGCFELDDTPTNWPAPKKQKKTFSIYTAVDEEIIPEGDSPLADRMLVSVFHRRTKTLGTRYNPSREFFGVPSLMVVTREEAKDFDALLRKCLFRAEALTTRDFLREEDAVASTEDSDTVLLNADDASDGRIQAESLESEDGMVDISMKDETEQPTRVKGNPPKFERRPIAPMLKPGSFITPGARNLFEMRTFSSGTEMVPLGAQTFMSDEVKKLPSIASRLAAPPDDSEDTSIAPRNTFNQHMQRMTNDSPPTSDEDDLPPPAQPVRPAPVDDGSDSEGFPPVQQLIQPALPSSSSYSFSGSRRNSKIKNTYSRKDKRKAKVSTSRRQSPSFESEVSSKQPLLRLGECIVLDWTDEGYDALFAGSDAMDEEDGPSRGSNTWDDMPVYTDPELEEKRRLRSNRSKSGFSLGDCLDEFGKSETLSENDAWYCPRCKEHRRATKTFELWKAPDVLVIHLKRFSAQGRFNNKLDVMVDFPLEGLDLSSRLATKQEDGKSPIYDLFAVDNHYGGLGGGHYTAYAKNFIDKNWYEYNDSYVTRKKDETVVTKAAYLLFYRRQSNTTLGGPIFEHIMSASPDSPSASNTNSRGPSPSSVAGEGKRLDDSSRNGSSSALRGVGAGHQAGGGGLVGQTAMRTNNDEEELPAYSTLDMRDISHTETLEGMDVDDDEAIGLDEGDHSRRRDFGEPAWSFQPLNDHEDEHLGTHIAHLPPPNSDAEDDKDSVKVGSATSSPRDRMAEFADDEGTTMDVFGTPPRNRTPMMDEPWGEPVYEDDDDVAEIRVDPPTEEEEQKGLVTKD